MKIIFSHYGTLDGGDASGFTRSFLLATELAKLNNQVIFLTTQGQRLRLPFKKELRDGVKIFAFPDFLPISIRKGGFALVSAFCKCVFILFNRADIVHSDTGHRPSSGWPCLLHRFIYKSKYCSEWWEHFGKGGIFDDMPTWYKCSVGLYDNLFEKRNRITANCCVAISDELKKRAITAGIPEEKILVLNGGADVKNIPFSLKSQKSKEASSTILIGIIGINDAEIINHLNLIKAIKALNRHEQKYLIIGTGSVSKTLVDKYNLAECVQLLNWLPYQEFCLLLSSIDLFALFQRDDLRNISRFPNKLGDYLAASRPVLTNGVGEVAMYLERYPEAIFYTPNLIDDIQDAIIGITNKIKSNSINYYDIRKIAIENSWSKRAETLNDFYKKCYS